MGKLDPNLSQHGLDLFSYLNVFSTDQSNLEYTPKKSSRFGVYSELVRLIRNLWTNGRYQAVAIEVKGSWSISARDLRPLRAFIEEHSPAKAFVVCNEREERLVDSIRILPWRSFLSKLWHGEIIS